MLSDFKNQLLIKKAQGAYFVAETALASGEALRAASLYADHARDLSSARVAPALQVQGWLGVIRCAEILMERGKPGGRQLTKALTALGKVSRSELPQRWSNYDAWRDLMVRLLGNDPKPATLLGRVLARWFPNDPRPHYALGRAWEIRLREVPQTRGEERERLTRKAIAVYQAAITASGEQGCAPRWEPTLKVRIAGLMWRHLRDRDPEAATDAARVVDSLGRVSLTRLDAPYQIIVAQIRLGQGRAMDRLRALDLLESAAREPEHTAAVLRVIEDYLESLGWSYYATEQDRVRAILERCAPVLGSVGVRRVLRYLDLLRELRGVTVSSNDATGSTETVATAEHLRRLLAMENEARGDSVTAAYYWTAVALARQPSDTPLKEALEAALVPAAAHLQTIETAFMREPVALALGALEQLLKPDPRRVRELLLAFASERYQVPHVQGSFALLAPTLVTHWQAWPDLQPAMRAGMTRFIHLGERPSYGIAALGLALLVVGESEIAEIAGRRALAEPEQEDPELLLALKIGMASGALDRGKAHEAVRWLLGA